MTNEHKQSVLWNARSFKHSKTTSSVLVFNLSRILILAVPLTLMLSTYFEVERHLREPFEYSRLETWAPLRGRAHLDAQSRWSSGTHPQVSHTWGGGGLCAYGFFS